MTNSILLILALFGRKKSYSPTVTPEDKEWVENSLLWLIENFGLERLNKQPFISPTYENFPYTNLKDPEQFQQLFEQLCGYMDLDHLEISVKFFDDLLTKQWNIGIQSENAKFAMGFFERNDGSKEKPFSIQVATSSLEHADLLVAVLVHELTHVKLLGGNYLNGSETDMEPLTDLATIYFGFGIFVANTVQSNDIKWMRRLGYLPNQIISYTNALICYLTESDAKEMKHFLNQNTNDLFQRDLDFLTNTKDTVITKDMILAHDGKFRITKQIESAFENRDFDGVIELSNKLLERNSKDVWAYCNIGYSLLQQKMYAKAIVFFNKVIDTDPYWDYPYNNRGYCKLQLGDLDNGAVDIFHAFEMNEKNSFAWRNIGVYYLMTDELDKALEHLLESERIDPNTDLINFYLSRAYSRMGDDDKAIFYTKKSTELKEYNDSVFV
jgi:tetratricopeptide (TPR) repeat protein